MNIRQPIFVTALALFVLISFPQKSAADVRSFFNGDDSGDWNSAANWSEGIIPDSDDDVNINAPLTANTGPAITINTITFDSSTRNEIEFTVSNGATFHVDSYNVGIINGNVHFLDDSSNNGSITGSVIFSNNTFSFGTIIGDAVFYDGSRNEGAGTIIGNATFRNNSYNLGTIEGDAFVICPSENPPGGTVSGTINYTPCEVGGFGSLGSNPKSAIYNPAYAKAIQELNDAWWRDYAARNGISTSTASSTQATSTAITTVTWDISVISTPYTEVSQNLEQVSTTTYDIFNLQKLLNANGFTVSNTGSGSPGNETNFFGPATKAALIRFQIANKLPPTGFFGPMTKALIQVLGLNK